MYAPQMPCEGVSAIHPISAASSSTYQLASPSRTQPSGLLESPFLGTKEALATQRVQTLGTTLHQVKTPRLFVETFKRARQASIPTLVPLNYSCITDRYNISFAKPGITVSVCLSFVY